jgi:UDPglucose 6-dehydrogenase
MITIIGTGYVGLVTGACFAEIGQNVLCVDTDAKKIESLKNGRVPFHEPGLDALVLHNQHNGRLRFTTDLADAKDSNVVFIAVGTPPSADGSANLDYVLAAARGIGKMLQGYAVVVVKSTVPVGTGDKVRQAAQDEIKARGADIQFDVVSNPEFLKEGDAIADFMRPDRVVVGSDSPHATAVMKELYAPLTRGHERMIVVGRRDAEMIKYVSNTMLATKISLMNEVANICERTGVDVEKVRMGVGADTRIGHAFIAPGCGYGGSCFPKDVKALIKTAEQVGFNAIIMNAVDVVNELQKRRLFEKVVKRFGPVLDGHTFGLWGLAFKPGTDDMREAPSLPLLQSLIAAGAKVQAYDPVAMKVARETLPDEWFADGSLKLADHQYDAVHNADAMILVTDWKHFHHSDFDAMKKKMKQHVIFDGRNQYDPHHIKKAGFEYYSIGR